MLRSMLIFLGAVVTVPALAIDDPTGKYIHVSHSSSSIDGKEVHCYSMRNVLQTKLGQMVIGSGEAFARGKGSAPEVASIPREWSGRWVERDNGRGSFSFLGIDQNSRRLNGTDVEVGEFCLRFDKWQASWGERPNYEQAPFKIILQDRSHIYTLAQGKPVKQPKAAAKKSSKKKKPAAKERKPRKKKAAARDNRKKPKAEKPGVRKKPDRKHLAKKRDNKRRN